MDKVAQLVGLYIFIFHKMYIYIVSFTTLKRENEAFQKWLSLLTEEDRTCIENYLNAIEHAHFQEEQRAYYQGMIDVIQIFMGLGVIKKRNKIEALLNKIVK